MSIKKKALALALSALTAISVASVGAAINFSQNTALAATNGGSITLDTANYIMAPNNIYDIGVVVKKDGRTLSGDEVNALVHYGVIQVEDSRTGSIATLTQLANGNFRVKGKNEGSCYITYRVMDGNREVNHASVKIDVKRGVKQGGTSVRNTSVFDSSILEANTNPIITNQTGNVNANAKYSIEQAKNIALTHAKVTNPMFNKIELDYEYGRLVYEIEFYAGNTEYDYTIDANTGAILKYDYDIENFNIPTSNVNVTTGASTNTNTGTNSISVEQAKSIAIKHANVTNPVYKSTKLDYEYGRAVYEIEFYSGNTEYDYTIDASTGKILSFDYDIENFMIPVTPSNTNTNTTTATNTGLITAEQAKQKALTHAKVPTSTYAKVEIDYEYGVKVYEIEFKYQGFEYDYVINANNGNILKSEKDRD